MGTKKTYNCDLCHTDYRTRENALRELIGLNFSGMRKFKLDGLDSTEGSHICIWCAGQIVQQAPKLLEGKVVLEGDNHEQR